MRINQMQLDFSFYWYYAMGMWWFFLCKSQIGWFYWLLISLKHNTVLRIVELDCKWSQRYVSQTTYSRWSCKSCKHIHVLASYILLIFKILTWRKKSYETCLGFFFHQKGWDCLQIMLTSTLKLSFPVLV